MPSLAVHYLPQFVAKSDLAESVVVVVDLLRASTTICHALAAGAKCVVPCLEVDETLTKAQAFDRSEVILGGERGGQRIEGFDFGNSPTDYTADQVFGKTVLFTTTNGTRALAHARLAARVLIGSAVNRSALVESLASAERIDILCAGTGGQVTREDILAAGGIVDELFQRTAAGQWQSNEWAEAAHREWQELLTTARATRRTASEQFTLDLRDTTGGKNLLAIGYDADLEICAQLDTLPVVPELDHARGEIRLP
ncbi:MAG: 2-phosphosulfolactate phosphatase [Planctomycetes bacterium]|nr:2-phosphosulfolactate phosphatase [Planctomycetota bacterium]